MSDKIRYPLMAAWHVAKELVAMLEPACERIVIAGSIRRNKPTVGDIELVYVPKKVMLPNAGDLFGELVEVNAADVVPADLIKAGVLGRRLNIHGHATWGGWTKLAVHLPSGIPVDLFATTSQAWYNYLVCRTGGAETNKAIAVAAQRKGWTWHPYGAGFTQGIGYTGTERIVRSERDVFEFVGLPYLEPRDRQ